MQATNTITAAEIKKLPEEIKDYILSFFSHYEKLSFSLPEATIKRISKLREHYVARLKIKDNKSILEELNFSSYLPSHLAQQEFSQYSYQDSSAIEKAKTILKQGKKSLNSLLAVTNNHAAHDLFDERSMRASFKYPKDEKAINEGIIKSKEQLFELADRGDYYKKSGFGKHIASHLDNFVLDRKLIIKLAREPKKITVSEQAAALKALKNFNVSFFIEELIKDLKMILLCCMYLNFNEFSPALVEELGNDLYRNNKDFKPAMALIKELKALMGDPEAILIYEYAYRTMQLENLLKDFQDKTFAKNSLNELFKLKESAIDIHSFKNRLETLKISSKNTPDIHEAITGLVPALYNYFLYNRNRMIKNYFSQHMSDLNINNPLFLLDLFKDLRFDLSKIKTKELQSKYHTAIENKIAISQTDADKQVLEKINSTIQETLDEISKREFILEYKNTLIGKINYCTTYVRTLSKTIENLLKNQHYIIDFHDGLTFMATFEQEFSKRYQELKAEYSSLSYDSVENILTTIDDVSNRLICSLSVFSNSINKHLESDEFKNLQAKIDMTKPSETSDSLGVISSYKAGASIMSTSRTPTKGDSFSYYRNRSYPLFKTQQGINNNIEAEYTQFLKDYLGVESEDKALSYSNNRR